MRFVVRQKQELFVETQFKILFLCTGNSARSILAEYIMKKASKDRFSVYSAGSHPKGHVHPLALKVLKDGYQLDANDARSKSIDELKNIHFDFVITLCDIAREECPILSGSPITAHWGVNDPADYDGPKEEHFYLFRGVGTQIQQRINLFCSLPFEKLDNLRLEQLTKEIGQKT